MEMSNSLKEWALREVKLATEGTSKDVPAEMKGEMDKHYEVAYRAFCDFIDRAEGLDKPGIAKTIFTQLLHEEPLTPIEDNEDDWVFVGGFDPAEGNDNPGWTIYQCKRRSSLFKKVTCGRKDGEKDEIKFSDMGRYVCIDINTEQMYTGGMGSAILDEMIPISMPYSPLGKIKIFTEDFKCHEDFDGDSDTVGILYFRMPDGQMKEIKRFFKEDYKTHEMKEIGMTEYLARKKKAEGLKRKEANEVFDSERGVNK